MFGINLLKKIINYIYTRLHPGETPAQSKEKWDALSRENAKYFIYSDEGENLPEETFRASGKRDFKKLILQDAFLMEHIAPLQEKTALEIGCGIGRITEEFGNHFKKTYAFDISPEMIHAAKKRLDKTQNITFESTDGETLPVPDASIDFIFSFIVFQHMPTKEMVEKNFKEIYRTLAPRGIAKIQVRGKPTEKGKWFSGVSFTPEELSSVLGKLTLMKSKGAGEKYFWLWLTKE